MHIDECSFLHDGRAKIKCTAISNQIKLKNVEKF